MLEIAGGIVLGFILIVTLPLWLPALLYLVGIGLALVVIGGLIFYFNTTDMPMFANGDSAGIVALLIGGAVIFAIWAREQHQYKEAVKQGKIKEQE